MAASAEDLIAGLSEEQQNQSVEEYLKGSCVEATKKLKRHFEGKITDFEAESKKARQTLRDVGNQQSTDEPAGDSSGALSEPFALVAVRGCHVRKVFRLEPTVAKTKWSVGRSDAAEFCLAGDDEVSSQHAQASAPAAPRPARAARALARLTASAVDRRAGELRAQAVQAPGPRLDERCAARCARAAAP